MTSGNLYNNIGFEALAIMMVLRQTNHLVVTKALLILPIVSHKELLRYLSNGKVKIQGLEKLLIDKMSFFSNFNKRFYDHLCGALNAIQLLAEIDALEFDNGNISLKSDVPFHKHMGSRVEKISKASANIAKILNEPVEKIYLNLRIEL